MQVGSVVQVECPASWCLLGAWPRGAVEWYLGGGRLTRLAEVQIAIPQMPLCQAATASRLKYLAIVATTVIATTRPSAAFVGSFTSASATSSKRGGRRQPLTMGSPPLGAEERVVIVGGGIGEEKGTRGEGFRLNLAIVYMSLSYVIMLLERRRHGDLPMVRTHFHCKANSSARWILLIFLQTAGRSGLFRSGTITPEGVTFISNSPRHRSKVHQNHTLRLHRRHTCT